jgi:hypothetical protein
MATPAVASIAAKAMPRRVNPFDEDIGDLHRDHLERLTPNGARTSFILAQAKVAHFLLT